MDLRLVYHFVSVLVTRNIVKNYENKSGLLFLKKSVRLNIPQPLRPNGLFPAILQIQLQIVIVNY